MPSTTRSGAHSAQHDVLQEVHRQQVVHAERVDRRDGDGEERAGSRTAKHAMRHAGAGMTPQRDAVCDGETEDRDRLRIPRPRVRIHGATLDARGCSSVGRAPAFQAGCRRFEPGRPLRPAASDVYGAGTRRGCRIAPQTSESEAGHGSSTRSTPRCRGARHVSLLLPRLQRDRSGRRHRRGRDHAARRRGRVRIRSRARDHGLRAHLGRALQPGGERRARDRGEVLAPRRRAVLGRAARRRLRRRPRDGDRLLEPGHGCAPHAARQRRSTTGPRSCSRSSRRRSS